MHQTQCPSCQSYNVVSISPKHLTRVIGVTSLVIGVALLIALIGIPLVFIGVALLISSIFLPENDKMRCKACKFIFTQSK